MAGAGGPTAMLVTPTSRGLFCAAGDFYIDPWQPVDRAVITHAHGDHARPGSASYLCAARGKPVLQTRLGPEASIEGVRYGETRDMNGAKVSLHPAGHVLGSSQVRIEHRGEVWVVSGDYKLDPDPTCDPFQPIRCDTFITESTFGLPIYRWCTPEETFARIDAWWRSNGQAGRASVLFGYAFGKAQRILASVDASIGPIVVHGAVEALNRGYRECGVALPETRMVTDFEAKKDFAGALVVAPPSAQSSPWLKRFGDYSDAFASGWMAIRGARRRRAVDQGFVLSDHADWPSLNRAIAATGAQRIFVTHGHTAPLVQWLREKGLEAHTMKTEFEGEAGAEEPSTTPS
ncbi:MAG TPA: ligase-associated DNA damage response exonuclease [Usitatibacter sp.]|nr:ligase-associated DNA damage response exonuclease [Usitatibacter sp.]